MSSMSINVIKRFFGWEINVIKKRFFGSEYSEYSQKIAPQPPSNRWTELDGLEGGVGCSYGFLGIQLRRALDPDHIVRV